MTAMPQAATNDRTDAALWRDLVVLLLTVGRALEGRLQRGALVAATAAGRTAYERARPGFTEELHTRFSRHLDPAEQDRMQALVQRVLSTVAVQEVCEPSS